MKIALVLGAAVWPTGPSPTLNRRTRHAAALFHAGAVTRIVVCGGLGLHPPTEAEAMHAILRHEGVPDAAIVREAHSRTTGENLAFAKPLLPPDVRTIVIVTDRYHALRSRLVARRLGLTATTSCPTAPPLTWRGVRQWLREGPALLVYALTRRATPRAHPCNTSGSAAARMPPDDSSSQG